MIFRNARHTQNLESIISFYTSILRFNILGSFENHNGYDGVFLGKENTDWHLEFTSTNEVINSKYDEDDILVFYPTNEKEYEQIVKNIKENNIEILLSKNPYWKENGILIQDPDKFNIIISPLRIN